MFVDLSVSAVFREPRRLLAKPGLNCVLARNKLHSLNVRLFKCHLYFYVCLIREILHETESDHGSSKAPNGIGCEYQSLSKLIEYLYMSSRGLTGAGGMAQLEGYNSSDSKLSS